MKRIFYQIIIFTILLLNSIYAVAQTKRVLFLGNSYTAVNNLPMMLARMAASAGDQLIYDSNTPGGYRFYNHVSNAASLAKIAAGNWDVVVLQEQSQFPSFPDGQVETEVFPYARQLDSLIHVANTCTQTVFYMTWGRKNGDASNCVSWPPVCTYAGMDSLLNLRYRMMADSNRATVSAVGAVWNYIRKNYSGIELYQSDESHPSLAGTYAAACTFYTTLYREDPSQIGFDTSLSATEAANIRAAVKTVIYDSLSKWRIGANDPKANYTAVISGINQINFTNLSKNANQYKWYFGDGDSSSVENPVHIYAGGGSYQAMLLASRCGKSDTTIQTLNTSSVGLSPAVVEEQMVVYPNPVNELLYFYPAASTPQLYRLVNLMGQEMLSGNIRVMQSCLDVSALPDGMYILELSKGGNGLPPIKFVKSRDR